MRKRESKVPAKVEAPGLPWSFESMEKRFEDFFRRPFSMVSPAWWPGLREAGGEIAPWIDIYEEGDEVVVKAELPGMKKEDLEVQLTDDSITISGEKKKEGKVERKGYYRHERAYGSFTRSFGLPSEVNTDDAKAEFQDGVLEIRVPKTEEAKKKVRKLSIH